MKKLVTMLLVLVSIVGLIGFQPVSAKKKTTYHLEQYEYILDDMEKGIQVNLISSSGKKVNAKKVRWSVDTGESFLEDDIPYDDDWIPYSDTSTVPIKVSKKGKVTLSDYGKEWLINTKKTARGVMVNMAHRCVVVATYKNKNYFAVVNIAPNGYSVLDDDLVIIHPSWWDKDGITCDGKTLDYVGADPEAADKSVTKRMHFEVLNVKLPKDDMLAVQQVEWDGADVLDAIAKKRCAELGIRYSPFMFDGGGYGAANFDYSWYSDSMHGYGYTDNERIYSYDVLTVYVARGYALNQGKILFATSTYTPYGEYITNTEKRPIKSQLRLTDLTWEYIFGKIDGYMEKKNDIYKKGAESWNIYDIMKVVK